ncbi:o-succinylbenzoate synthase [Sporosarcina pasteurii]|uniref:o-succinylbenzoate synthase n=1 Tax=Sporosarcina pasteurii TaxID=1474 RepID=A0A380C1H1_SPOPA|nr:o-succinylbenzoate synthase [Sporosarcina pasteurii]MDS9471495.1 o-succinylbenzoate synthase [Sporosarcina pasteurii]QBQ04885.1 o-succinylbenzoate synthase [Sporosarcina pasteurii]SUJ10561.1 o-succinylbenzoate synthase [Sporosarcina pasteurii]
MIIKEVTIRKMKMSLKDPFTTSFGTFRDKDFLLLEAKDELGNTGWGESVAFHSPWYSEETLETNLHMIKDFLLPLVLGKEIGHPDEVNELFSAIRRNNMAKSTVEGAIWDLYAKRNKLTLAEALGGEQEKIEVGISIGIDEDMNRLVETVGGFIEEGYKRIKVKIKPGFDVEVMRELRRNFPDVPMMADANSAYTLEDVDLLKQLDEFNLTMIEQPLASDDIIDHATLQKQLETPICLDESIHSLEDTRKAIELGSTKIINIKIGRVGGLTESKKIHDYCMERGIPVWCGGMLESGIGRAHNVALTTLPNFILPGDTAGSSRYWEQDIISPEVVVEDGYITVPTGYGIGYEPDFEAMDQFTVEKMHFKAE